MKKRVKKDFSGNVLSFDKRKFYFAVSLISVLVLYILFYFLFLYRSPFLDPSGNNFSINDDDFFKCLSKVSTLYVQKGCSHCVTQKNLLGEGIKYLNVVDCFDETEKCSKIAATPTWIINGEKLIGVHSLEKLKSISGC